MTFEQAKIFLMEGNKIRRETWGENTYLYKELNGREAQGINGRIPIFSDGGLRYKLWQPTISDFFANDWVEEKRVDI